MNFIPRFTKIIFFALLLSIVYSLPVLADTQTEVNGSILYTYTSACPSSQTHRNVHGIIVPKGTTEINTVYYYFHGWGNPDPATTCSKLCGPASNLSKSAIFLHSGQKQSGKDRNLTSTEMTCYTKEALNKLKGYGITVTQPPNSILTGHSAGGLEIQGWIKNGFNPNRILVFDGCYGDWCTTIAKKNVPTTLYYASGSDTTKSTSMRTQNTYSSNVKAVDAQTIHDNVPATCFLEHTNNSGKCTFTSSGPAASAATPKTGVLGKECHSDNDCAWPDGTKTGTNCENANGDKTGKQYCDCNELDTSIGGIKISLNESKSCTKEYGQPSDGGIWKCIDGANATYDLDYCLSTKGELKFPIDIPAKNRSAINTVIDAVLDLSAASKIGLSDITKDINDKLEINIPNLNFSILPNETDSEGYLTIPWIGEYLAAVYKYAMVAASILAVVMIIIEGIKIIISGGGEMKTTAYKRIGQIATGLCILWGSYALMYTINPDLVTFKSLKVKFIEPQLIEVTPSTETPASMSLSSGTNGIPYFGQYDSAWASLKPGDAKFGAVSYKTENCSTIQERGCGSTSLAMILKYLGENVNPIDTAHWSLGCNGGLSVYGTIAKNKKGGGMETSPWPNVKYKLFPPTDRSFLDIAAGKGSTKGPILFNCSPCIGYTGKNKLKIYGGHYMVITGQNSDGTFSINDPGGNPQANSAIIKMTREQIVSPNITQWKQACNERQIDSYYTDEKRQECLNSFSKGIQPNPIISVYLYK